MYRLAYHYYIISKRTNRCTQYINTNTCGWSIDDESSYSIEMDGHYAVVGAYLIDGTWYRKVWNEFDEYGEPILDSGFEMVAFEPEFVG